MELDFLNQYLAIPILAFSLCWGYILKKWVVDLDNKYIPTILFFIGIILNILATKSFNLDVIISGGFSALASTGLHQFFKSYVESLSEKFNI